MPDPADIAAGLQNYDPNAPTMKAYQPTLRDHIAALLMGDDRASPERRNFVQGLVGSSGLGNTGMSLSDLTPAGNVFGAQESAQHGDIRGAAMNAMFLGPAARTADHVALAMAQKMAGEGADRAAIHAQTGWFTGADGKWRFEIPDNTAGYAPIGLQHKTLSLPGMGDIHYRGGVAGDLIDHPQLYAAYPSIKEIGTGEMGGASRLSGSYSEAGNESFNLASNVINSGPKQVMLHEMQHAVQAREGFARGGTPAAFERNPMPNPDLERYRAAMVSDPHLSEFHALRNSPQRKAEQDASNELWNREYEPRLTQLQDRQDRGNFMQIQPEIDSLFTQYKDANRQFPILQRHDDLAEILRGKGIPLNEPKPTLDPHLAYNRLAGEVEARNVEARMNMTPAERAAKPPWMTQDVPDNQQIIRGLLGQ